MYTVVKRTYPPCPYCNWAEGLLRRRGADYKTIEYAEVKELMEAYGLRTVPQIFEGDSFDMERRIGGYKELQEHFN